MSDGHQSSRLDHNEFRRVGVVNTFPWTGHTLGSHVTRTRVTRRGEIDFPKRRRAGCSEFEPRQGVKEPGLGGAILTSSSCSFTSRVLSSQPFFFLTLISGTASFPTSLTVRPFLSTRHSRQVSRTVYPTSYEPKWLLEHL